MKINNSELQIFVEKNGNKYKYEIQEPEKKRRLLDNDKKRPGNLSKNSDVRKGLKIKIKEYLPPIEYEEFGIDIYINNLLDKLDEDLRITEDNNIQQNDNDKDDFTEYPVKGYAYRNQTYCKVSQRNDEIIYGDEVLGGKIIDFLRISDYSNDTKNNFEVTILAKANKTGRRKKYKFIGPKERIVKNIVENNLGWKEKDVTDFIFKFAYTYSADNTEEGVVGGYESFDNIKKLSTKEEDIRDISELTNYFKTYLTPKHIEVMKTLLLIPFHWILRKEKSFAGRGFIKFVVIHGAPGAFKNGIVNIVRNMFNFHDTISIDAGGTPNTYASLRNAIHDNLGIVLCDESNNVFIDDNKKFKNTNAAPVENLLKGIFQTGMPKVSTDIQGINSDQQFHGTPVFIWNEDFKKTKALEDRCYVLHFDKPFKIKKKNMFDVNKFEDDLMYFGNAFASCFAKYWDTDIKYSEDYDELMNKILTYMNQDYKIDTEFIVQQDIHEENEFIDVFDIFFNRMYNKIYSNYNYDAYFITDTDVREELWKDLKTQVNFLKGWGKNDNKCLYLNKNRFVSYIRDHIAEDGGFLVEDIEKIFQLDNKNGKFYNINNVYCYKMDMDFFLKNINNYHIGKENEEEKKEVQDTIV